MPREQTLEASGANDRSLENYVAKLQDLELDKRDLAEQIKEVLKQADDAGYDKRALRQVVKLRLMTADERQAHDLIADERDRMMAALGMLADLPLGQAATRTLNA